MRAAVSLTLLTCNRDLPKHKAPGLQLLHLDLWIFFPLRAFTHRIDFKNTYQEDILSCCECSGSDPVFQPPIKSCKSPEESRPSAPRVRPCAQRSPSGLSEHGHAGCELCSGLTVCGFWCLCYVWFLAGFRLNDRFHCCTLHYNRTAEFQNGPCCK